MLYDFKVSHFQRLQIARLEVDVRILGLRVPIALCCKGNVSTVRQEHSIFLHGACDNLSRRLQVRDVIGSFEAEVNSIRRGRYRPRRSAGVRGWMDEDAGANSIIRKNEPNCVIDRPSRQLISVEEQGSDREIRPHPRWCTDLHVRTEDRYG